MMFGNKDGELRRSLKSLGIGLSECDHSGNVDFVFGLYGNPGVRASVRGLERKINELAAAMGYEEYRDPPKSGFRKIKKK